MWLESGRNLIAAAAPCRGSVTTEDTASMKISLKSTYNEATSESMAAAAVAKDHDSEEVPNLGV